MYNKIIIKSIVNPDWNGTWHKAEVECEMKEVGCNPDNDYAWIVWIADHVIGMDTHEYTGAMEAALEDVHVTEIKFKFSDGDVTFTKC